MTKKSLNELREKIPAAVWAEKWGKRKMNTIEKAVKEILSNYSIRHCSVAEGCITSKEFNVYQDKAVATILRLIEKAIGNAHMAGQADAGVDPGYSNARAYCIEIMEEK